MKSVTQMLRERRANKMQRAFDKLLRNANLAKQPLLVMHDDGDGATAEDVSTWMKRHPELVVLAVSAIARLPVITVAGLNASAVWSTYERTVLALEQDEQSDIREMAKALRYGFSQIKADLTERYGVKL